MKKLCAVATAGVPLSDKKTDVLGARLDAETQRFVQDAVRCQLSALVNRNIEDAAVVVLGNASGDVLAWSGSSGVFSAAREVDGGRGGICWSCGTGPVRLSII